MSEARLSKEDKDRIVQRYRDGDPVQEIADAYGVHHSYPTLLARRRGIPTRAGLTNTRYKEAKNVL